jgi:hypothetical protein
VKISPGNTEPVGMVKARLLAYASPKPEKPVHRAPITAAANRVVFMGKGEIVEDAPKEEFF